jgi:hypothetical protein
MKLHAVDVVVRPPLTRTTRARDQGLMKGEFFLMPSSDDAVTGAGCALVQAPIARFALCHTQTHFSCCLQGKDPEFGAALLSSAFSQHRVVVAGLLFLSRHLSAARRDNINLHDDDDSSLRSEQQRPQDTMFPVEEEFFVVPEDELEIDPRFTQDQPMLPLSDQVSALPQSLLILPLCVRLFVHPCECLHV